MSGYKFKVSIFQRTTMQDSVQGTVALLDERGKTKRNEEGKAQAMFFNDWHDLPTKMIKLMRKNKCIIQVQEGHGCGDVIGYKYGRMAKDGKTVEEEPEEPESKETPKDDDEKTREL